LSSLNKGGNDLQKVRLHDEYENAAGFGELPDWKMEC
jgi:hypothetical protein